MPQTMIRGGVSIPPRARTLLDIFEATVLRCGERTAIDAGDGTLTYSELAARARMLALRLGELGVGPGDRVGVRVASGTSELYVAILGVLAAGAAYVPVDAEDPPARAADVFQRSNACAVVGDRLIIDELASPQGDSRPPGLADDAWIIFTSGSTGVPKGVAVNHRAAAAFVDAETRLWHVAPEDRVLAGLSVGFDASCEEMWLAWRNGAALVPAPRAVVRAGWELGPWLRQRRVTVVSTVPTLAAMWGEDALAEVRLLILGGEACPAPLAWRLAAGREVWNTYGPTEATVVSTAARVRPGEPVTIGSPLDGWKAAIVDQQGSPVPDGEEGELVIAGVGLARYLDPMLDIERFAPAPSLGWDRAYCTGDLVRQSEDGLVFLGRRDHQVKIGGRRIELGEIDTRLAEVPGVKAAASTVREAASGNRVLVGYVTGEVDAAEVRNAVACCLPGGLVPLVVKLDELPQGRSGKVDRAALPWPPPVEAESGQLNGTSAWVAERWRHQLGPLELTLDSDFFELGGTSLAAAKLASALRKRFPAVAVADLYAHRRLGELVRRLDHIGEADRDAEVQHQRPSRRWGAIQLAGVLLLLGFAASGWLIGVLGLNQFYGGALGPQIGWLWLITGWIALVSAPGRALLVIVARRLLLIGLRPGRYPRHSWLTYRIWFVERLAELCHLQALAGTPWATRYARLGGHHVGRGARLGTLPPPTSLVQIGEDVTLEPDVDLQGWWIDGQELVVGVLEIGNGARVGTRSLLMPGSVIGEGAEVEPGTLVIDRVPAGERWAGSPARRVGRAGDGWRKPRQVSDAAGLRAKALFGVGLGVQSLLVLLASVPGLVIMGLFWHGQGGVPSMALALAELAPLLALSYVVFYALVVAAAVRAVSPLVKPGWYPDDSAVAWALWFTEAVLASARGPLFALFASVYTRPWLRLLGVRVGRRTEVSTAVGLNRLISFGEMSFAADDVVLCTAKARGGWIYVSPIEVGDRSFLGNSAILQPSTRLGDDSLLGVMTPAPRRSADGTSWFGSPALELPRVADSLAADRTTNPPVRLILARGATEVIRILLPATAAIMIGAAVIWSLDALGSAAGLWAMAAAAPLVLALAGASAALLTVAVKWLLIGRYRPGEHPLWSFFVWRDEIVNTCQEQLAGGWLLGMAQATPLMSVYLRMMGAKVGHDVWCESLNLTEFDVADLGDGCVINRHAVVQTHLFHDRLMRIGPATLRSGATLGPASAMLPDTELEAHCRVGGRSVVMRGERLPSRTRWHGAPVLAT